MKQIWLPQVFASGMLLWALNPDNPYGYYILLRWVCCAVFAYLPIWLFRLLNKAKRIGCGFSALPPVFTTLFSVCI
jgi:hypothetical protein